MFALLKCEFSKILSLTLRIINRSHIKIPATGKIFLAKANAQQIHCGWGPVKIRCSVPTSKDIIAKANKSKEHSKECKIVLKKKIIIMSKFFHAFSK